MKKRDALKTKILLEMHALFELELTKLRSASFGTCRFWKLRLFPMVGKLVLVWFIDYCRSIRAEVLRCAAEGQGRTKFQRNFREC